MFVLQQSISYLCYVISGARVAINPKKIVAVANWSVPKSVKEHRGFLGLTGYDRKFIRHFGLLAKPLTVLLRKNSIFKWTSVHDQSFQALKSALSSAPVLALPNFSQPFCIETDASIDGIGAVLTQGGHPLAYISKALGPHSCGLSTYEK